MTHSKDFVEIYPVRNTDKGSVPVYDESARGNSKLILAQGADFGFNENPNYVQGAYENLRHHVLRDEIEAYGLPFVVGTSHLLPIDDNLTEGQIITTNQGEFLDGILAGLIGRAARAGRLAGATHVEIKIS
jgi:hypothetical protein